MPYTQGASNATGPYTLGGTQTYQQANNAEYQYVEAVSSLHGNLFTAFVLTGLVATKDGTTASQLDVTAGTAYVKQADGTLRQRTLNAFNESCSGNPSTTLYLDLNPDGTVSWGTAHSGQTNYLPIAQVTTDASSNILTVTDERALTTNLLLAASAPLNIPAGLTAASLPPVTQVNNTNAGSTTAPQVKTTSASGLSTEETTVGSIKHIALVPTATDSAARGLSLGYTDAGGAYHEFIGVDSTAGLKFLPTGAIYRASSFFSGTGTGTFSHGFPGTPSWIGITCNQSGSSMTVGVDSMGSSTCHVVTGGSLSWMGMAHG